jgi:hypothetical protein
MMLARRPPLILSVQPDFQAVAASLAGMTEGLIIAGTAGSITPDTSDR